MALCGMALWQEPVQPTNSPTMEHISHAPAARTAASPPPPPLTAPTQARAERPPHFLRLGGAAPAAFLAFLGRLGGAPKCSGGARSSSAAARSSSSVVAAVTRVSSPLSARHGKR
eukprot:515257-Prymnesium_polylepis.1